MQLIKLSNNYTIRSISLIDLDNVEKLCNKCLDYFLLASGMPPTKEEVESIFTDLPPGKSNEDKFVLGIYGFENELTGIIDIVKNYPVDGEWILGLLLIEPSRRGCGLGRTVHEALVGWAKDLGAKFLRIGYVENNNMAAKFWASLGYSKIDEVNTELHGKSHIVNVMTLNISN